VKVARISSVPCSAREPEMALVEIKLKILIMELKED
jgi:hypothetical protein